MSTNQPRENRLAREKSPYLLQHARNPVDWYPFGEEAITRARTENKPIFLSIGYSTCHWCHVMERESFEDPGTAAVMNERFVNVKVDREERPDVDQVYMQAVMAMTGQGGWPLSVWLTPELKPFYGGTYFPPDSRWGRPGFRDVLLGIAKTVEERPEDIEKSTAQLMDLLSRRKGDGAGELGADLFDRCARDLSGAFDSEWGGFGRAPKFPRPSVLSFMVHRHFRAEWDEAKAMLERTLDRMWRGGIYDHVGGGFSRYSTDDRWLVPHFEKMLYDNAMLVDAYVDGHLLLEREDFADVVRDVLAFVDREMTHPEGGFFSAQDADSEGEEGRFYVFTATDLDDALGEDAGWFRDVHEVTSEGNFEGKNVLWWPRTPAEIAADQDTTAALVVARHRELRERLYTWRERRVRPGLDDKVITSWNGLMIATYARAGAVLGEPAWVETAARAAEFVETRLRGSDGTLLRRWRDGESRFDGSLDDYTYYAHGLLRLFEATGASRWLARVMELLDEIEERFADPAGGGYWFASAREDLVIRLKDSYDGALPSGNGMQALLLSRLGGLLDREDLRERALQAVRASASELERVPEGYPLSLMAWAEAEEPPRTLLVVGDGVSDDFRVQLQRAHRALLPGRIVVPVTDSERAAIEKIGVPVHGKTSGTWLCEDASCREF